VGSSDAVVRTFWCKKTPDFSKFMVCPHRQRELSQRGQFADKWGRGGEFFAILCGRPSCTKHSEGSEVLN